MPILLSAEEVVPDFAKVKVTTPVYSANTGGFKPVLGTYSYSVKWQGIPAATAEVNVEKEGEYYRVIASARTNSAIDIFYKLRYKGDGTISALDFAPVKTVLDQRENSKVKVTEIMFLENGEIYLTKSQKGKEPEAYKFNPENFTLDPFSAAFLARSLDWKQGETKTFDVFTGKARYLLDLSLTEEINMNVNDESRKVWVIVPKVKKLSENEGKPKLREAKIYITADDKREILKIVSSVFIGSVTSKLESFSPTIRAPSGIYVAQEKRNIYVE